MTDKETLTPEEIDQWFKRLNDIDEQTDSIDEVVEQFDGEIEASLGKKKAEEFSDLLTGILFPSKKAMESPVNQAVKARKMALLERSKASSKRIREQVAKREARKAAFKRAMLSVYKEPGAEIEVLDDPKKDGEGKVRARFKSSQKVFEGILTKQGEKWVPSYQKEPIRETSRN